MKTRTLAILLTLIGSISAIIGQTNDNSASVLLELSTSIPITNVTGRIGHIAYNSKQQLIYVAALSNNTVEIVDMQNKKKLPSLKPFNQPEGLAYVSTGDLLFVACLGDGLCKIFDVNTNKEVNSQRLGGSVNTIRFSALQQKIFIGYGDGSISIYDANSVKIKSTIKLSAHPESFQLDEKLNKIYVNVPKSKQIEVIDLKDNVVKSSWKLTDAAENYPMALDTASHRLFIGCRNPSKLLVLDSENGNKITAIDIDGDVNDIFFNNNNKQVYVSCGDGYLDVFKQDVKMVQQVIKQETKPVTKPAVAKNTKNVKGKKSAKPQKPVAKQEIKMVKEDTYQSVSRIFTSIGARTSLYIPELNQIVVAAPAASGKDAQLMVYQIK
jgi:WD40 repeat protein